MEWYIVIQYVYICILRVYTLKAKDLCFKSKRFPVIWRTVGHLVLATGAGRNWSHEPGLIGSALLSSLSPDSWESVAYTFAFLERPSRVCSTHHLEMLAPVRDYGATLEYTAVPLVVIPETTTCKVQYLHLSQHNLHREPCLSTLAIILDRWTSSATDVESLVTRKHQNTNLNHLKPTGPFWSSRQPPWCRTSVRLRASES